MPHHQTTFGTGLGGVISLLRGRRPVRAAGLALLACALAAGCSTPRSQYHYVTNAKLKTFVKVPAGWAKFGMDDLITADEAASGAKSLSPDGLAFRQATEWAVGYDGAPQPAPEHMVIGLSTTPLARIQVRTLMPEERSGGVNLRNLYVPVDELVSQQAQAEAKDPFRARADPEFTLRTDEQVKGKGTIHGVHLVYTFKSSDGLYRTVDQTTLMDDRRQLLYSLLLSCTATCYLQESSTFDTIQKSFTVLPS